MSRRSLAQVLDSAGALDAVLRARACAWASAPWLTVLTYHRIHENPRRQAFDREVIDATPQEFDDQVGLLRRYFNIVGLEDVFAYLRGRPLPPNPAIITFDDGYKECYEHALPVLLKHRVKAVFFIATSYLTQRKVFWWDRISYVVRKSDHGRLWLQYPHPVELDVSSGTETVIKSLLRLVKRHPGLNLERFLDELTEACGVEWNQEVERRFANELLMTWDQVRALQSDGMEVHSHTRTHRVLQTVPVKELASELSGARKDLEEQLNRPVRAVSYPVGHSIASFPAIRSAVRDAGYIVGFSNTSGVTSLRGDLDPLDMRRISTEHPIPPAYFKALLALPSFSETAA